MGFSLADVPQGPIRTLLGNRAFSSGAIATATVTSQVKSTATIYYTVDGVFCSKGATDNLWTLPATKLVIGPGSAAPPVLESTAFGSASDTADSIRYFFLGLDAAGTAYAYKSDKPPAAMATQDDILIPDFDAGVTIVGILKVTIAAGYVFTPATTLLGAAHVTVAYTNLSMPPVSLP
jgi:hypothetical protein